MTTTCYQILYGGIRRMINNIKGKYLWPELELDVRNFIRKCNKCQLMKYSREGKELMHINYNNGYNSLEKNIFDSVGPLERDIDGIPYILTIPCELIKYIDAYSLSKKGTITVARFSQQLHI